MKKTFEEVIEQYLIDNYDIKFTTLTDIGYSDCINLMKLVRLETIEECANKAEADCCVLAGDVSKKDIEVYVLKESILQLDKNSIEI